MSKTVRLTEGVYNELESVLWRRETFSHGVFRLLETRRLLLGIAPFIEGQEAYNEGKAQREAESSAAKR